MPDLEPITREEMLLDGQDLEPITRKEMFIKRIYDKTQVIPEPITREEMFLKKAGDETTDVTIEQLNVSENGTYSEDGVAYSPVIVNVPAPPTPDNAYLLNEVEGLPKDIVTFTDGSNLPMPSLKVSIEPIQSGSGDPSPTNIRPISGWTEANVTVADDVDNPTVTHTTTIPFVDSQGNPVEVYGGSVDVVNGGEQPITLGSVDLGTLTWTYRTDTEYTIFQANLQRYAKSYVSGTIPNILCSHYIPTDSTSISRAGGDKHISLSLDGQRVYVQDSSYTDATAFKTAMSGVQLVYELATPTTFYTQPTSIKSLDGENNVWADTGKIEELEYFSKEV